MYFLYEVTGRTLSHYNGSVATIPTDFKHYEKSLGVEEIYYKVSDAGYKQIICEATNEFKARKTVIEFLRNING